MTMWIVFIIGLVIGWLVELLIDYFYWRPKRICTDAEKNLQASLSQVQTENSGLMTQLDDFRVKGQQLTQFETSLQTREAELASLSSNLEAGQKELDAVAAEFTTKEAELGRLSASYDMRAAELNELETRLQAQQTQLTDLSTQHHHKKSELTTLATNLESKEAELRQLSLTNDSKARELTDYEAQLKLRESSLVDQSAELTAAQSDISNLQARIRELEAKIADRNGSPTQAVITGAVAGAAAASRQVKTPQIDEFASGLTAGDVTVSGTAAPGTLIEVIFDGRAKGTTPVDDHGRWTLIAHVPQEGHYNVQARVISPDRKILATSPQRSVQLRATKTPLAPAIPSGSGWDDLQRIWGIGPQIDKVLRANGIDTFAELAGTDVARLDEILRQAGRRFKISKQETWAEQARLAAAGKWDELKELQAKLDWKGRRRLHISKR